eukprot:TRINITY_DN15648_c0_g1_i1.p1 TRINITY_DN15648_c0_g1~~TRINITY_DN15648_c0_g1_i1.p1  ORF type:complete len:1122 (+),score=131.14 TRINITY_DN15648_c0_g1_i1:99-3464(+)
MQRARSLCTAGTADASSFRVPPRYRFSKLLGSGSYGVVAAFFDSGRSRGVAIKRVRKVFDNFLVLRRTLREIRLMRHCRHPNVLRLYKVLPLEGTCGDLYLSLELMDCDLDSLIHSRQAVLSDHQVRYFTSQMLLGLSHLHGAHVIHRDLKPANIFVRLSQGQVKIGDLGLSRGIDVDDVSGEAMHPSGELLTEYVVTRWYRAPEVLLARSKYGPPVDVWSVGCILYEMWVQKALFPGKNSYDQLRRVVQVIGIPSDADAAWVPPESQALLQRCCQPSSSESAGKSGDPTGVETVTRQTEWAVLTTSAVINATGADLLRRMCGFDPNKRSTVDQALQHQYLAGLTTLQDREVARSVERADVAYDRMFDGIGRAGETAALLQLGRMLRKEIASDRPSDLTPDHSPGRSPKPTGQVATPRSHSAGVAAKPENTPNTAHNGTTCCRLGRGGSTNCSTAGIAHDGQGNVRSFSAHSQSGVVDPRNSHLASTGASSQPRLSCTHSLNNSTEGSHRSQLRRVSPPSTVTAAPTRRRSEPLSAKSSVLGEHHQPHSAYDARSLGGTGGSSGGAVESKDTQPSVWNSEDFKDTVARQQNASRAAVEYPSSQHRRRVTSGSHGDKTSWADGSSWGSSAGTGSVGSADPSSATTARRSLQRLPSSRQGSLQRTAARPAEHSEPMVERSGLTRSASHRLVDRQMGVSGEKGSLVGPAAAALASPRASPPLVPRQLLLPSAPPAGNTAYPLGSVPLGQRSGIATKVGIGMCANVCDPSPTHCSTRTPGSSKPASARSSAGGSGGSTGFFEPPSSTRSGSVAPKALPAPPKRDASLPLSGGLQRRESTTLPLPPPATHSVADTPPRSARGRERDLDSLHPTLSVPQGSVRTTSLLDEILRSSHTPRADCTPQTEKPRKAVIRGGVRATSSSGSVNAPACRVPNGNSLVTTAGSDGCNSWGGSAGGNSSRGTGLRTRGASTSVERLSCGFQHDELDFATCEPLVHQPKPVTSGRSLQHATATSVHAGRIVGLQIAQDQPGEESPTAPWSEWDARGSRDRDLLVRSHGDESSFIPAVPRNSCRKVTGDIPDTAHSWRSSHSNSDANISVASSGVRGSAPLPRQASLRSNSGPRVRV